MSKRTQIERSLDTLGEISGIMNAMRSIALNETHKLSRFLVHQHRVLAGIETAAADFLNYYEATSDQSRTEEASIIVVIGSQRGFCGDFNEALARALQLHCRQAQTRPIRLLVVGRRLKARIDASFPVAATFDGATVVEKVPAVLREVMEAVVALQARDDATANIEVLLLAHRDGEDGPTARSILPAFKSSVAGPRFSCPPMLNQGPRAFYAEMSRHYIWARMHDAFFGSLMVENRRRLRHMEGAIQRIDEKMRDLRRKGNTLRQEEITEEIELLMLSIDSLSQTYTQSSERSAS